MKQAANDIVVEGTTPVSQVITYLEQLVDALKAGAVRVRQGDDEVVLGPGAVVDLSVHAKARNKRHRLSLELTWRRTPHAPDGDLELQFAPNPEAKVGAEPAADAKADAEAPGEAASVEAAGGEVTGSEATASPGRS